jgi:hypothetical protein
LLKIKNQFLSALDSLIVRVGDAPNILRPWKVLRTDNAGEMTSKEAQEFYNLYRIFHEKCNQHQHWQNPRAEAAVGELGTRARVMMAHAGEPGRFWGFAIHYACDIDNRFLPYKAGSDMTCWEAWFGSPPDNTLCPTWGCRAYVYIERKRRKNKGSERSGQKFGDTSAAGIFLGFATHIGHKGSLVLLDDRRTIVISTHVTYNEGIMLFKSNEDKLRGSGRVNLPRQVFGDTLETMEIDTGDGERLEIIFTDENETEIQGPSSDEEKAIRTRAQAKQQLQNIQAPPAQVQHPPEQDIDQHQPPEEQEPANL